VRRGEGNKCEETALGSRWIFGFDLGDWIEWVATATAASRADDMTVPNHSLHHRILEQPQQQDQFWTRLPWDSPVLGQLVADAFRIGHLQRVSCSAISHHSWRRWVA
jgi:hypothetical protein